MSFTLEISGMEALLARMEELEDKGRGVAAQALYEGAGVVADSVSSAVHGIATEKFHYTKFGTRLPSPEEKALVEGARKGVAKFKKSKTKVNTSVGMQNAGYGQLGGQTKPIPLIANSINSGTSFMKPQPFFRRAAEQSAGAAAAAIESGIESRLDMLSLD